MAAGSRVPAARGGAVYLTCLQTGGSSTVSAILLILVQSRDDPGELETVASQEKKSFKE